MLAITRFRVVLVVSLALTWIIAGALRRYAPKIKEHFEAGFEGTPETSIWGRLPQNNERLRGTLEIRYSPSKVALMVEPRPLPHLIPQLLHMMLVVPSEWRFLFVGSNSSVMSISRSFALTRQQELGKLDLAVLPLSSEINALDTMLDSLANTRLYEDLLPNVEWIFQFNSESILCANSAESLDDWLFRNGTRETRITDGLLSGNGGLVLRRVSTATGKIALEEIPLPAALGLRAPGEATGVNGTIWHDRECRREIFDHCPELSLVMDMKLERERCANDNGDGTMEIFVPDQ